MRMTREMEQEWGRRFITMLYRFQGHCEAILRRRKSSLQLFVLCSLLPHLESATLLLPCQSARFHFFFLLTFNPVVLIYQKSWKCSNKNYVKTWNRKKRESLALFDHVLCFKNAHPNPHFPKSRLTINILFGIVYSSHSAHFTEKKNPWMHVYLRRYVCCITHPTRFPLFSQMTLSNMNVTRAPPTGQIGNCLLPSVAHFRLLQKANVSVKSYNAFQVHLFNSVSALYRTASTY